MKADFSLTFPVNASLPTQVNALVSSQLPNSSIFDTVYGIDTPRRSSDTSLDLECEAVFDSQGAGTLSTVHSSWAILAWGYDHRHLFNQNPLPAPLH